MLSPNIINRKDGIKISCIWNHLHSPGLCRYCVEPVEATCIVEHFDQYGRYVSDYCCWECGLGWFEIGDRTNDLVV